MKFNAIIFICILSCLFFQVAPVTVVLLSEEVRDLTHFVEDPLIYLLLTLGALLLILLFAFWSKSKKISIDNMYDNFNKHQSKFWFIGEIISYVLFIPAFIVSLIVYLRIMKEGYGDVEPTTKIETIILYAHLTGISFLFAGYSSVISTKKLIIAFGLIILPRFIISVSGPRIFVFQALLPCFFFIYPVLKHIIKKYLVLIIFLGLLLVVLPFMIGNRAGGELSFISIYIFGSPILYMMHSPLKVFDKMHFVVAGLLFSLLSIDVFGYKKLFDLGSYKVRFDWVFTRLTIGPEGEHFMGAGGNPIYEAYSEGIIGFIVLFALVGFVCSYFDIRKQNLFNRFVFPHIIVKIGFLWRGTFVELFDRTVTYFLIFSLFYLVFIFYDAKSVAQQTSN